MTARQSALTDTERLPYLYSAGWNMTYGYPEPLTPDWIREWQSRPPARFWDFRPAGLIATVSDHFRTLFETEVFLAESCSQAFGVAAAAVLRPGDEVVVIDRSFEPWPGMLESFGGPRAVVYARRAADGQPDVASITAACTDRTRAVVLVSPDNPLGVVCSEGTLRRIAILCRQRDITLITDHCLAEVDPTGRGVTLLPRIQASIPGLSWITVGDTGKILLGTSGPKFGAIASSEHWRQLVKDAASVWFLAYRQDHLAIMAAIMTDSRFPGYLKSLENDIAANHQYLARTVRSPLSVSPLGAGCFALVDSGPAGLDGAELARCLARVNVHVSPVSLFPTGGDPASTQVRIALSRPLTWVARTASALNAVVIPNRQEET